MTDKEWWIREVSEQRWKGDGIDTIRYAVMERFVDDEYDVTNDQKHTIKVDTTGSPSVVKHVPPWDESLPSNAPERIERARTIALVDAGGRIDD